ncbi:YkgJ family cysteine cluster protein [Aeromonas dhakensis]|uniref:YkgJ family cysteine cluster protein n=1 Tax=Aeromonas dhakensis TaxID=196024 RepID=UPI000E3DAC0E|nr:YkgJ family cysteine cluster protein [Aeromonas dhakensis]RFS27355.1 YkgJ family cysteine cluster protein [Aeromonas dhakensis]HDX8437820.1 YkgJ family cysteine cluster protein [Aeromonas dhakensis]
MDHEFDEKNPKSAVEFANVNREKIIKLFPASLSKKEEGLYLRMLKSKGNYLNKLSSLFSEMNEIYAYVDKYTPCEKGCSHCCYIPVAVSELEVEYIERSLKIKRKSFSEYDRTQSKPCPFLKNNSCSIYNVRPFVCRRHVVLTKTPYWCELERCNQETMPLLNFTETQKSFEYLVFKSGKNNFFDIREVF